jgi:hypothetical protein
VSWQIGGGDAGIAGGAVADGAGAGVVLSARRRGRLGLRTLIRRRLLLYGFVVLAYNVDREFNDIVRF